MLITRKTRVPNSWAFFAQLIIILSIYAQFVVNAPFILLIKKYLDNPATIMGLISLQIYLTFFIGPLIAWLSDRIWTKFGRRKIFVGSADLLKGIFLICMPFAPNLWVLVILRWLYDFFGDLAAPAQAMIYEVVPAKQRGMSGGFMKAFMNIGNLVFFTLLLGRFHDAYFMGPFQFFSTPSGGTIMFVICGLLFFGAAIFEFIGIKEIYPVGRKRLNEGRKPGENIAKHFVRSVFGDVFAKDLAPLYLLLFANVMFGFSLGVFQPLLFIEQWNYDLQMFGNTIAIGVPLGIVLGLLGGWMADRFGKMKIVFITTIGNLLVNIAYTIYVYYQPDYRPSFWEIVAFGNLAYVFGAIKGVASGPLLWEYVSRNRMGGATAGIQIFNSLFRNSVGVIVGGWLLIWSIWFFPQAGYNVELTLNQPFNKDSIQQTVASSGLNTESVYLRPIHQPGVDGDTSRRWWIHQEDTQAQDLIKEREDLQNKISHLEGKKNGFFTDEAERTLFDEQIQEAQARIEAIETSLKQQSEGLEERLSEAMASMRFTQGEQLLEASFEDGELILEVLTIEALPEDQRSELIGGLRGEEFLRELKTDQEGIPRWTPILEVETIDSEYEELNALRLSAQMDPRFIDLFDTLARAGYRSDLSYDIATSITALTTSSLTTRKTDYRIEDLAADRGQTKDGAALTVLHFRIIPNSEDADTVWPTTEEIDALFASVSQMQLGSTVTGSAADGYRVTLQLEGPEDLSEDALPYAETRALMAAKMSTSEDAPETLLGQTLLRKFAETLAARPYFVTVPSHQVTSGYDEREYEYFFSSQILQIGTDVFGIFILLFIIFLEKRGTLHRYGAEEDDNR